MSAIAVYAGVGFASYCIMKIVEYLDTGKC